MSPDGRGGYNEPSFRQGWTPTGKTYLEIFMHVFPMTWFSNVLLARTNVGVVNSGAAPLTFGELLRYIGIRLLMAACSRWNIDQFWNYKDTPPDQEDDLCPYNFCNFMSRRRFNLITKFLDYTDLERPAFPDKFWQVRQVIKAFNDHMAIIILCG